MLCEAHGVNTAVSLQIEVTLKKTAYEGRKTVRIVLWLMCETFQICLSLSLYFLFWGNGTEFGIR